MNRLLTRLLGAPGGGWSNGRTTAGAIPRYFAVLLVLLGVAASARTAEAAPQDVDRPPAATSEHSAASIAAFFGGAAAALGAHESGHLLFDAIFDAHPGLKKVSYHGIPFFAITHDAGLSPRREFTIDSAGFWVQEAGNELILVKRPDLRNEHAPLLKGVFAFNVLASAVYAGAAFGRTGPIERDTRGIADSLRCKEPWVGVLILAPAVLDVVRFFRPDAQWAVWGSRGAKIGGVLLIAR
jgi:hypothetical protein